MTNLQTDSIFIAAPIGASFPTDLKKANLDHLSLSFSTNGVLLSKNTPQSDIDKLNQLLVNHDSTAQDPYEYRQLRAQAYPKAGDQLDEIMKWLNASTDSSIPQDLKDIAKACIDVKTTYPKPSQ